MSGSHKPRRSWRHRVCMPHPCNTVNYATLGAYLDESDLFEDNALNGVL
jgi:hypothetical protein